MAHILCRMWCRITIRRWAKRLLVLVLGVGSAALAARAMEQASGYGSVGSILLHPLHLCAHFSKEGLLELLLDTSHQLGSWSLFDVNAKNSFGMTALHTAALAGSAVPAPGQVPSVDARRGWGGERQAEGRH